MERYWWKESVVYQIYPISFHDSNGDGFGDLRGIINKLDYIETLGVDVIWLTPVYQTPNADYGYDISNYQQINEQFGTLSDWEELLENVHQRGMKLIMDLVVNHSSDEHAWFVESRSSKDSRYRDYYIWRPADQGNVPNNWESIFGGSAWEYDSLTGEYYLHLFDKKQADFNWENDQLRQEIYQMMRWWLDKGIDGFRMDVINLISKTPGLPNVDAPEGEIAPAFEYFSNGPKVHDYLQEMYHNVLSHYDIMTVGETPNTTIEDGIRYSGNDRNELNMIFQFEHMHVDQGQGGHWDYQPWKLTELKQIISKWQTGLHEKGWNSLYLGNHDQPRIVSRFGDDQQYRVESAKLLATLLLTLQGTPYIFQGEEIGITNVQFNDINEYPDVWSLNFYKHAIAQGKSREEIFKILYHRARDNARTPIPWDDSANGGFTTGTPWMKLIDNYQQINVQQALKDKNSIFYHYQSLIQLRKNHPVLVYGDYQLLLEEDEQVWAYVRTLESENVVVLLNFSEKEQGITLPKELHSQLSQLLINNYEVLPTKKDNPLQLKPYEARVYKLQR